MSDDRKPDLVWEYRGWNPYAESRESYEAEVRAAFARWLDRYIEAEEDDARAQSRR
jgi:hypothetical protein